jgi:hypothetical protein
MANNPKLAEVSKGTQFSSEHQPEIPGGVFKKGKKHLTTWIQNLLEDEDFEANILDSKIGIKEYKGAPIAAIIQVLTVKAINGDVKAIDLLMKYGWSQKLQLGSDPENPLPATKLIDSDELSQFMMLMKTNTKQ